MMQSSENLENTLFSSYLDSVYVVSGSKNSINAYRSGLNQFTTFVDQTYHYSVNQLVTSIKDKKTDVFKVLQGFVIYLRNQGKKSSTINLWLSAVKGYLRHYDVKIYSEDFRQNVKLPKKTRQREEPLTKELIVRLLRNAQPKLQTVILVAVATGMRIGEIVQLKISDIDFGSKPTKIRIRSETTKTRESREVYLTSEATNSLKDYLSRFFGWKQGEFNEIIKDQIIFGRTSKSKKLENDPSKIRAKDEEMKFVAIKAAINSLENSLRTNCDKVPELSRLNENGRMMIHFHAFRKFFRTTVSDVVGRDYAEAMIGHHFYMDTYYNLPDDKKREMYLKAEPYLTISDYAKIEKDLNKITEKQREIEEEQLLFKQFITKHYVEFPKELQDYLKKAISAMQEAQPKSNTGKLKGETDIYGSVIL